MTARIASYPSHVVYQNCSEHSYRANNSLSFVISLIRFTFYTFRSVRRIYALPSILQHMQTITIGVYPLKLLASQYVQPQHCLMLLFYMLLVNVSSAPSLSPSRPSLLNPQKKSMLHYVSYDSFVPPREKLEDPSPLFRGEVCDELLAAILLRAQFGSGLVLVMLFEECLFSGGLKFEWIFLYP